VTVERPGEVERLSPGIEGLDLVMHGGLPCKRLTLVTGTAGSGKTLLAVQYLADGIARGEPAVFVTFEERPEAIRQNFRSFGWDIGTWQERGLWSFVDASPAYDDELVIDGGYDLSSLVLRIKHACEQVGAKRVALDSTGSLIDQFGEVHIARRALFQIAVELEAIGVTTVMTAERPEDYGPISRYGFEEFVADNVVILRNALEAEKRRRTVEVLKLRGGSHLRGEHLFSILPGRGIVVVPQEVVSFGYASSRRRLTSGLEGLDAMLGGGLFDKSLTLVSGATGTGKSLLASHFVAGGVESGERAMLLSFEESHDQLARNAAAWGLDFERLESEGRLLVLAQTPEAAPLEDHLLRMKAAIQDFAPDRVAIDSLTALQRIATARSFREYLLGLSFYIKSRALLGLMTATTDAIEGGVSTGALHVSTVSDTVVLLQYVGSGSQIRRGLTALKMRGSDHDKAIREFSIDDAGMQIGEPLELQAWTHLPHVL
jgi:circadian clock protein KaiC